MSNFNHYFDKTTAPVAEITYELPQGSSHFNLDLIPNPVITIKYADGVVSRIDTNLIYQRGYERGVAKTKAAIKRKLDLD